jgi:uncharacterized protein YndB with AHSA1/START domain
MGWAARSQDEENFPDRRRGRQQRARGVHGRARGVSRSGSQNVRKSPTFLDLSRRQSGGHAGALDSPSVVISKIRIRKQSAMKITVDTNVAAPIADVWRIYTTPEDIKQWNAASDDWHTTKSTVDLFEGGVFSSCMEAKDGSIGFDFAGVYTKIFPQKRIEYSFGDRTAAVEFTPGDKCINVCVTFDAGTSHPLEMQRSGWQAILNNFARYAEK